MKCGKLLSMLVILLTPIAMCKAIIVLASLNESCPEGLECTTLQQYASNPSQYSAVILELQSGNHTLNSSLIVVNMDNFTITGNDSRIVCTPRSGAIILTSIQSVLITEVSIIGCDVIVPSRNGDSLEIRNVLFYQSGAIIIDSANTVVIKDSVFETNNLGIAAVYIYNFVNFTTATIEGCVFSNITGRGIYAEFSDLEISRSTFFNNKLSHLRGGGGCIYAESSIVTISASNFTECTSTDGGAIYGQQVAFTITDTNFTDNEGYGGGAIAGTSSSFNISSSNFIRNNSTQWGGAIKADVGTSSLTLADTNFISNAAIKGGGVYTVRLDSLVGCSFMNNEASSDGGGLWVQTEQSITISNCDFVNNTNDECGGGAYISTGSVVNNISVSITGSTFSDNISWGGDGGGVYFSSDGEYASMIITESKFRSNTATFSPESSRNRSTIHGGGIYMSGDNCSISIDSSDFSMNSANGSGGAIYVTGSIFVNYSTISYNRAFVGEGGAIISDQLNVDMSVTQSAFCQNGAPSCGAISIQNFNHVVTLTDSSFTHNQGTDGGGGVACFNSSSISIIACNFFNNMAGDHGGVFLSHFSSFRFEDSHFLNNFALKDGGIIYSNTDLHNPSIISRSSFTQNTAGRNGGVLFIESAGEQLNISQSTFSDNSANSSGGVIHVSESTVQITETNILNNCAALGDVIYACDSDITFPDSQFTVSTDPSNCSLYNGNVDNFRNLSHSLINRDLDTNMTIFLATCPFEYDTEDVISSIAACVTETITTPEAIVTG